MPAALDEPVTGPLEQSAPSIFEKAVLLLLSTSYGIGLKRKIEKGTVRADADEEWIEGYKRTLQSEEFDAIKRADSQFKTFVESRCVVTRPGSMVSVPKLFKSGIYAVPLDLFEEVDEAIEDHKVRRQELISNFLEVYDQRCQEARAALGDLYNPNDYPTKEDLREKITFQSQYLVIGAPNSLKGISADIFKREAEKAQVVWIEFMEEAKGAMRANLQELLDHMIDQLTPSTDGKKKRFYTSTVEKLEDFFETFEARNIANDAELSSIVKSIREITSGVDPDELRKQEDLKISLSERLSGVKEVLDTMVEERPSRMFVEEEE